MTQNIQKDQHARRYFIFGLFIAALLLASAGCLQTNNADSSADYGFSVLNESSSSVSFEDGLSFIYEVQLSRVHTVEKWVTPIKIKCGGNPTREDTDAVERIIKDFNKIDGFPGMEIVDENENVLLIYATRETLPDIQRTYDLPEIDKGICQRFLENDAISRAIIVIESDVDKNYKNCVVLHEMFHMIGFYGHAYNNESVINQKNIPVSELSAVDTKAFQMLYNEEITVGMTYSEILKFYEGTDSK